MSKEKDKEQKVKILMKLKKFIRRIFVDYNFIKQLIDNSSVKYFEQVSQLNDSFEAKLKHIESKMEEVQQNIQEINNIYAINNNLKEINIVMEQLKYSNIELQNIKNDKSSKNILIIGFYGAPNLGDELMLDTLLEYLEEIPNTKITVLLSNNPEYDIDRFKDIHFIHYPRTLYDFNILAEKYDYFIFDGGAIINDRNYEKEDAYKYELGTILLKLSVRAIAFNKKVICLALSASSNLSNIEYIEKLKYVVENSHYFSVRDIYTKQMLLEKLGKHLEGKIIEINDVVLANKKMSNYLIENARESNNLNIGIVWIANDNNIEKLERIISTIERFVKENRVKHCNINLIPFYEYCQIDTKFYKMIQQDKYKNCKINIEKYSGNMEKTIELFRKNDIIIGMRYHSILIAYALAILCVSICYDIHEDYPNKIRYLNEIFKKEEALSYFKLQENDFIEKLENIQLESRESSIEVANSIEILAQKQILESIDKIFK